MRVAPRVRAGRGHGERGETDEWDACGLCVAVGGLSCGVGAGPGRRRPAAVRSAQAAVVLVVVVGRVADALVVVLPVPAVGRQPGLDPVQGCLGGGGGVGVVPAELCEVGHAHRDAVTETGDGAPVGPVGVGVVLADLDHLAHPVLRPCRRGQGQDEQGCCQGSGHCLPLCLRSSVHRPLARPAGLPAHGTSCQCWRYSPRPCRRLVRPGSGVSDLRAWQFDGPRGGLCGPEGPPEGAAGAKAARWTSFALAPVLVGRYGPGLRSGRAGSVGPSEVN